MRATVRSDRVWSSLKTDFGPSRLASTLATGFVMAMVNALLCVALMSLIFTGELRESLSIGIGIGLVGSAVVGLIMALLSSFPGLYAGTQDASAAILGLAAASIASSLVGPELVDTVLAMIVVTSLATGAVFSLMAGFRLGEVAKFVPFPVIGGLLAGTGYLIAEGGLGMLRVGSLSDMLTTDALGLLWPGVLLAVLYFAASRRQWSPRIYLWLLVAAIAGFHLVTQITGVPRADSLASGWLLGPFPSGSLWPGLVTGALTGADWAAIAGQAASLVTILLISPLTLLFYVSALEIGTKRDLDLDVELRAAGWANLAAGAVGGPPGYLYLADTLIAHRLVGGRRAPAIVAAVGVLALVGIGGAVLELLPQFVIAGLLLFVGAEFLFDWLWAARRRMNRLDYGLLVGIVVIIVTVGFLPGVIAGLVAAIALFVYRYSRIDVVKHLLTAEDHQSNIERPLEHTDYLRERGQAVLILELQGFVFFGTANRILEHLKTRLGTMDELQFLICDFRLVSGLDSSAIALFERIALLARDNDLRLLLTGLSPSARMQFSELRESYQDVIHEEADLDHGMAWCEDRLLEGLPTESSRDLPGGLAEHLGGYLVARTFGAGERLMTQGDPTPGIYLIRSGRATVLLDTEGAPVRLRTLLEGTVLGEISLYRREPCTATVITDTPCEVWHLTPQSFDRLCRDDPAAAAELHVFVARTLAGRVSYANRTISALQG